MAKFKIGDKVRCNDFHFERNTSVYSFDNKYNVMEVVGIDGKLVECKFNGDTWNYWENEIELATENQDERMTFKKGDIVEVIVEDVSDNIKYPVGTRWVVPHDMARYATVEVIDTRQNNKRGILWINKIKKVEGLNDMTLKIGDEVKGQMYGSSKYVKGNIIQIDNDDPEVKYLVCTQNSSYWLKTDTVELVQEKDQSKYEKLLNFVTENEIPRATVNAVITHLDKIEKLDFDIENTKQLCEQNENEVERLYDKLSKLEKERSELLK